MNQNERIAKAVEDGSYFVEARKWYRMRYLMPITARAYLLLFSAVVIGSVLLLLMTYQSLSKDAERIPFPVVVDDEATTYAHVVPLDPHGNQPVQDVVARRLIGHYVLTRESYYPGEDKGEARRTRVNYIKGTSTRPVFTQYLRDTNPKRAQSPARRFGSHIRHITITSIELLSGTMQEGQAVVMMEALLKGGKKEERSVWRVTVDFRLPDIASAYKVDNTVPFFVQSYRAEEIK